MSRDVTCGNDLGTEIVVSGGCVSPHDDFIVSPGLKTRQHYILIRSDFLPLNAIRTRVEHLIDEVIRDGGP